MFWSVNTFNKTRQLGYASIHILPLAAQHAPGTGALPVLMKLHGTNVWNLSNICVIIISHVRLVVVLGRCSRSFYSTIFSYAHAIDFRNDPYICSSFYRWSPH